MKKVLISAIVLSVLSFASTAPAQVPQLINFQGRVTVDGANFTGTGGFKFALIDGAGTLYWSNSVASYPVAVSNGLYSVLLGGPGMNPILPSVFANSQIYLRVWFNDGTHGLQQLSPDQRIAAVGYAMMAGGLQAQSDTRLNDKEVYFRPGADTYHGLGWRGAGKEFAGANVDGPVLYGYSGGGLGSTAGGENLALKWDGAGNVGIGTATPSQKLVIQGDDTGNYPDSKTLLIQGDTDPHQQLEIGYKTSGDYAAIQSIRQFTGVKPLVLNPSGGNVGIGTGTNAPQAALHVNGDAIIGQGTNAPHFGMVSINQVIWSGEGIIFEHPGNADLALVWGGMSNTLTVTNKSPTSRFFSCVILNTTTQSNTVEATLGQVPTAVRASGRSVLSSWHVIVTPSGWVGPGFKFEGTSVYPGITGVITYWY